MKQKIGYILMGVYVLMLIIGIVFSHDWLTSFSSGFAIISFIYIQQPGKKGVIDERERFILNRAGSTSYITLLTVLVFGAIFNDIIIFLNYVTIEEIFQILIGLGYMTFVSMYIFYSERV